MILVKTTLTRDVSKFAALRFLGLPINSRWETVAPVLTERIVRATRDEDHELVVTLTAIKSRLKKVLYHTCAQCDKACRGIHCDTCRPRSWKNLRPREKKLWERFKRTNWAFLLSRPGTTVNRLAKHFGCSRQYIGLFFRQVHGTTLREFKRQSTWNTFQPRLVARNLVELKRKSKKAKISLATAYRLFRRHSNVTPISFQEPDLCVND